MHVIYLIYIGRRYFPCYSASILPTTASISLSPKNRDILDIAAYYLKNIILLQAFPDANHRTALTAIEMFLENNNLNFDYTPVEAFDFRKNGKGNITTSPRS
jgi:prophage maintenance system killer protein